MYLVINFRTHISDNIWAFVVTVPNYFESTEPNAVLWD